MRNERNKKIRLKATTFLKVLNIEVPGLAFPKNKAAKSEKLTSKETTKPTVKKKSVKKKTSTKTKKEK